MQRIFVQAVQMAVTKGENFTVKIRLDQYLVQHGLTQSRERAKALIMSGIVFCQ